VTQSRRFLLTGIVFSLVVHGIFVVALILSRPRAKFCEDGLRCAAPAITGSRRLPDIPEFAQIAMVDASIIPRLGLAKPNPRKFPKLTKYEQPEKAPEAISLKKIHKKKKMPKANKHKKAQIDRHRKKKPGLDSILGAPEDDDKRKRPTALSRIVGSADGSMYSDAIRQKKGNIYAGRVGMAIRRVFKTPPLLSRAQLRRLKVRIRVTRLDITGGVGAYKVVIKSGNTAFDRAAEAAIQAFVPSMGGRKKFPVPDSDTLGYINKKGMVIDLEGKNLAR